MAGEHHLREAVLRLRQRQQRDVHRVVAVEIRIENQIRRIARVRDHAAQIGAQVRVGVDRRRGGRGLEFLLQLGDHEMLALALRQSLGRELKAFTFDRLHRFERGERLADLAFGRLDLRADRFAGALAHLQHAVRRNVAQQRFERPLIAIARELRFRKADVVIDARDQQEQHHAGHRRRHRHRRHPDARGDAETQHAAREPTQS